MEHLSVNDVISLLAVLTEASNPALETSFATRQRELLSAFRELIAADAWLCFAGEVKAVLTGGGGSSSWIYDGFEDATDPSDVFQNACYPTILAAFESAELPETGETPSIWSHLSSKNSSSAWPGGCHLTLIECCHPARKFRGISYFRSAGKPHFSARDRELAEIMLANASWLHARPLREINNGDLNGLSPREIEVTQLLLTGKSRKEVANDLELSAHTVTGYLKQIYAKLEVSSRAELLAKFIPLNCNRNDGDA